MKRLGPFDINPKLPLAHRLMVTLPMAVLGIIDEAVIAGTLGYVHPNLALEWGMTGSRWLNQRARQNASVALEEIQTPPQEPTTMTFDEFIGPIVAQLDKAIEEGEREES